MRFVGRESELKEFHEIFTSSRFEFVVVYGRRRIGKTTLISKACEGHRTIFHLAAKTTGTKTLSDLSTAAAAGLDEGFGIGFPTLEVFLEYIAEKAKEEPLILVIDEFPFFCASIPEAMGVFQRCIDLRFPKTRLKLVLSGSSVSFMEHQVLGDKSPLYGRRTAQFKILPFSLQETKELYGGSDIDTVRVQAITGGVPLYVSYFSPKKNLEEEVARLFFHVNGLLYNEPMNILNMEVNQPQVYFTVLELMARGVNKHIEISDKSGLSPTQASYYLSTLRELGLVADILPFGEKNKKRTLWVIKDGLFLFYFKHVYPYRALIERGRNDGVTAQLKKSFSAHMGKPFEEICKEYLLIHPELMIIEIGSWWGSDPRSKQEEEIDIVARTADGELIFGECKFTNAQVCSRELHELMRKSENIRKGNQSGRYYLFSKSGFTKELIQRSKEREEVVLVSLNDLMKRI